MPRKTVHAECKICGGEATVRIHSATGANGRKYRYQIYTHRNGISHYFRIGATSRGSQPKDAFQEVVDRRMGSGSFRFKEIKSMLESVKGSKVSNTNVYRNLGRAVRYGVIRRESTDGRILYSRRLNEEGEKDQKMKKVSIAISISGSMVEMTSLLEIDNISVKPLNGIPLALPVGSLESLDEVALEAFDVLGRIPAGNSTIAYSYSGQTVARVKLNRPVRQSESCDLFVLGKFNAVGREMKFSLPLGADSLKVNVVADRNEKVTVLRRFLDGLREAPPDYIEKGIVTPERAFTIAEFEGTSKGDTIVISFRSDLVVDKQRMRR
ncbi:MAG: hypothetical protein M1290_01190 [Candidatus Thermoplasmatota archaeon]|nr:hypothetical protein [Candidatus Thermoplasmatota archaeon]